MYTIRTPQDIARLVHVNTVARNLGDTTSAEYTVAGIDARPIEMPDKNLPNIICSYVLEKYIASQLTIETKDVTNKLVFLP